MRRRRGEVADSSQGWVEGDDVESESERWFIFGVTD